MQKQWKSFINGATKNGIRSSLLKNFSSKW